MSKPINKPNWNPSDPSKVVEPSSAKKAAGWSAGEKPAAEHFNWLLKNLSDWVDYIDLTDFTGPQGIQGPQGAQGEEGPQGPQGPLNLSVYASFAGLLIPTTGNMRWKPRSNATFTNVKMTVGVTPTTSLAVDILKNGVSIISGGLYPTIPAGSLESADFSLNVPVLTTDYITVNIISGDGQDLNVRIDYNF